MAKIKEKEQAMQLRRKGTSIKQIADKLHVSKSTVSVWCKDICLSEAAKTKLLKSAANRNASGLLAYSEFKRRNRQKQTIKNNHTGARLIGTLSDRDVLCIGLGLYWGEGYKTGNREFGFTNSDPQMILFYLRWLQIVFGINPASLVLRVSINKSHCHRIKTVESYWSNLTNIPLEQFTKPSLIATTAKKHYRNHSTHYGTLRVKVRGGSDYREQVLGAIQVIK